MTAHVSPTLTVDDPSTWPAVFTVDEVWTVDRREHLSLREARRTVYTHIKDGRLTPIHPGPSTPALRFSRADVMALVGLSDRAVAS